MNDKILLIGSSGYLGRNLIKKIKNTGVKYDNFQEDVGSWDKYGSEDYSTNYDISDILDD